MGEGRSTMKLLAALGYIDRTEKSFPNNSGNNRFNSILVRFGPFQNEAQQFLVDILKYQIL